MARKTIDESVKKKISESHAKGDPMRKIAREFGVSLSSVHRIVTGETTKTTKSKISKPRDKEERKKKIAELEKKIGELEKKIQEIEERKRT